MAGRTQIPRFEKTALGPTSLLVGGGALLGGLTADKGQWRRGLVRGALMGGGVRALGLKGLSGAQRMGAAAALGTGAVTEDPLYAAMAGLGAYGLGRLGSMGKMAPRRGTRLLKGPAPQPLALSAPVPAQYTPASQRTIELSPVHTARGTHYAKTGELIPSIKVPAPAKKMESMPTPAERVKTTPPVSFSPTATGTPGQTSVSVSSAQKTAMSIPGWQAIKGLAGKIPHADTIKALAGDPNVRRALAGLGIVGGAAGAGALTTEHDPLLGALTWGGASLIPALMAVSGGSLLSELRNINAAAPRIAKIPRGVSTTLPPTSPFSWAS